MTTAKKEFPYQETPKVQAIRITLESFFYTKRESKVLAREIETNLDNYIAIMERGIQRRQAPTQTPYWRSSNANV